MKFIFAFVSILSISSHLEAKLAALSDDFIKSINEKQTTWTAGRNFPEDTPVEHLKRLSGHIEIANATSIQPKKIEIGASAIPDSFDAREYWPYCESIGTIRNQGACGSCWAFSVAEAMSDRLCIASEGKIKFQFSPEELISCCSGCGNGCISGNSYNAWEYWVEKGVVSGGDYESNAGCQPYDRTAYVDHETPQCSSSCTNPDYETPFAADKHYGSGRYMINSLDVQEIQNEIKNNGPVQASYDLYEDFYSYKSGIYQHVSGDRHGSHAIKIIGWGIENEVPYWQVANSWGENWGDGGFFKILRGENHCGIETRITAGIPILL